MPEPRLPPAAQRLLEAEYDNMLSCIRCGLCLSVCPTYQQSFQEPEGPRARIAMARALVEGHLDLTPDLLRHWDNCILCEACTNICPSGVQMERIGLGVRAAITESRGSTAGFGLQAGMRWLLPNLGRLRAATAAARLYQQWGLQALARGSGILKLLRLEEVESMLPPVASPPLVPDGQVWEPQGQARATVALLAGCVMSTAFGETDRATARVLAANGCRVLVPPGQGCCGALHAHRGELKAAQELARRNIAAFEGAQVDAIVVNAAGCGATMKGYAHLLEDDPSHAERARAFSARVKDFTEFLAALGPVKPPREVRMRVTYQEPCHLANAQRVREAPRQLLRAIPGLELREMAESALCCGSGALYNLTQRESSTGLRARKVRNAAATSAEVIVTANPGCFIQLSQGLREAGLDIRIVHIADLLDMAYRDGG
ncbi:MAG: (Fe-S)-binding protein [Chloroflexi bacterium]|nr:(Fe-S)-binding protein [Chloroflexota bacterium]